MLQRVEGIVIKSQNYGETHKIITLFAKGYGVMTCLSRGANKPKSRLVAVSQPFIKATYLMYINKGLNTIQQGDVLDAYRELREDIFKTAYASYLAELTYKLLEHRVNEDMLYDQFLKTIEYINQSKEYEIPVMMYELKLYQRSGFAPIINQCVNCHKAKSFYNFSVQEGGLLCDECSHLDRHIILIPQVFVKFFNIFMYEDLKRVDGISVKKENVKLLRFILDQYYDKYGGFLIKSKRFLNQMDSFDPGIWDK